MSTYAGKIYSINCSTEWSLASLLDLLVSQFDSMTLIILGFELWIFVGIREVLAIDSHDILDYEVVLCLEIINFICLLVMSSFVFVLSGYWRTFIWELVGQPGYDDDVLGNLREMDPIINVFIEQLGQSLLGIISIVQQ